MSFARKVPGARASSATSMDSLVVKKRQKLPFEVEQGEDPIGDLDAPEGNIEAQTNEVLEKVKSSYSKLEKEKLKEAKDLAPSGFYRVLVFNSPKQADAFIKGIGEDVDQQYYDGRKWADRLNIAIPEEEWKPAKRLWGANKNLQKLAMPMKREIANNPLSSAEEE